MLNLYKIVLPQSLHKKKRKGLTYYPYNCPNKDVRLPVGRQPIIDTFLLLSAGFIHMYEARIEWVRESLNPSHVWFEQWTCVQGSNKDFYSIQIFSIIIIAEQTLKQKKITLLDHKIDIPVWLDFRIFFWSTEKSHLLLCQNSAMSYPALKSIFEKLCSELKNINVYIIACWLKCSRVNMSFRWLWTSLLMALKKKEANNWKN